MWAPLPTLDELRRRVAAAQAEAAGTSQGNAAFAQASLQPSGSTPAGTPHARLLSDPTSHVASRPAGASATLPADRSASLGTTAPSTSVQASSQAATHLPCLPSPPPPPPPASANHQQQPVGKAQHRRQDPVSPRDIAQPLQKRPKPLPHTRTWRGPQAAPASTAVPLLQPLLAKDQPTNGAAKPSQEAEEGEILPDRAKPSAGSARADATQPQLASSPATARGQQQPGIEANAKGKKRKGKGRGKGKGDSRKQPERTVGGKRVVEVGWDAEVREWQRQQKTLQKGERRGQKGAPGKGGRRKVVGKKFAYALDTEERPKPPCRFFKLGRCSKGAECPYPHTGEPVTRFICCRYFKQGSCMKGALCEYSHDLASEPCKHLVLTGACPYGERCAYSHAPMEDEDEAAALRDYFLDLERLRADLGLATQPAAASQQPGDRPEARDRGLAAGLMQHAAVGQEPGDGGEQQANQPGLNWHSDAGYQQGDGRPDSGAPMYSNGQPAAGQGAASHSAIQGLQPQAAAGQTRPGPVPSEDGSSPATASIEPALPAVAANGPGNELLAEADPLSMPMTSVGFAGDGPDDNAAASALLKPASGLAAVPVYPTSASHPARARTQPPAQHDPLLAPLEEGDGAVPAASSAGSRVAAIRAAPGRSLLQDALAAANRFGQQHMLQGSQSVQTSAAVALTPVAVGMMPKLGAGQSEHTASDLLRSALASA